MHYIAICLNREFCGWSSELPREEYEDFDFSCPNCYEAAIVHSSNSTINTEDEILGFLLPLIAGEAGDSKESME
jgi:predicted RNA-binding Zn-ribbon protein involved in translation (DUF1610 family)